MKKLLFLILILAFSVSVFAKNIEYKLANGEKKSNNYTYSISYPIFNNKYTIGYFANKEMSKFLKNKDGIVDAWAKEYKVNDEKIKAKFVITRCDEEVISGCFIADFPAQGNVVISTFNYGYINGAYKNLKIKDVFIDKKYVWISARESLINNYNAVYVCENEDMKEPKDFGNLFFVSKKYLSIIMPPGMVAPKENGQFIYKIEYIGY